MPAEKPSRVAIWLSAAVMPGAGQLAQKRWGAAAFYGGMFTALFAAFMVYSIRFLVSFYRFGLNAQTAAAPRANLLVVLSALAASLVIYAASMADTYRAYRRQVDAWNRAKLDAAAKGTEATAPGRAGAGR
jgi:hypothetical protein